MQCQLFSGIWIKLNLNMLYQYVEFLQFGSLLTSTVENNDDGTMDLEKMKERIRLSDDPHFPYTRLICVENTHNYCGGKVIPVSYMKKVLVFFIFTSVLNCLYMLMPPLPFPTLLGEGKGCLLYHQDWAK